MARTLSECEKIERSINKKYRKELWNAFIAAVKKYELVLEGDRIAVCISGGKDSMLMAKLMQMLQRYSDVRFETEYLVMDPGYNKRNRELIEHNAKLLEIWFPNIRDADAAILTYDGQVYMIDCGDEKSAARTAVLLRQLGIDRIDILFNSHLHHDHINGLALTDDVAKVKEAKICFETGSTASGELLEQICAERNIPITQYQSGNWFTMGERGEVTLLFLRNYDPMMDMNNQKDH